MTVELIGFSAKEKELINKAYKIRQTVFVKEQNVDKRIEYDGLDEKATHYLVTVDNIPVATARWRETQKGIKLERFAVLKSYRKKSLAGLLLNFILDELKPSGKNIYLHAQAQVERFYAGHGFKKSGEPFYEADIKHYFMEYKE
ncbi:MAG: GNAT family N-acetyltransferase [Bacteroidota bacterium]|nr:GNAT family N-acetyltransferase [Bacteroidota bacterium]